MIRSQSETESLRRAYASLAGEVRPSSDCLPAETIWAAVCGELPPVRRREIGLHITGCPVCVEAFRLAREVSGEAGGFQAAAGQEPGASPHSASWWLGWGALAAVAALGGILVVGPFRQPPEEPATPGFRAPMEEPVRSLLGANARLPRGSFLLRWTGPEGARYTIRVATEELTVIDRAFDLESTEYLVPENHVAALPPGARVVWRAEAILPDGRKIRSRSFIAVVE